MPPPPDRAKRAAPRLSSSQSVSLRYSCNTAPANSAAPSATRETRTGTYLDAGKDVGVGVGVGVGVSEGEGVRHVPPQLVTPAIAPASIVEGRRGDVPRTGGCGDGRQAVHVCDRLLGEHTRRPADRHHEDARALQQLAQPLVAHLDA